MTAPLNKVKAMLVAACDSCHQDNRDIAMNMMEIALDELRGMDPQDIEDGLQIVSVADGVINEGGIESACFNDELTDEAVEELDNETANTTFKNMIANMFVGV